MTELRGSRSSDVQVRMIEAVVVVLAAGLVLQLVFYGHGGHDALSDLPRVFLHRGVGPGSLPYIDRAVEYPVVSGVFLYLAALVSPTPLGVLLVTALASAAVCIAITVVLEARFGPRAWRWAIGVPVLLYAFQNWDIFAIGALLVGLLAFEGHSDRVAGLAFGVGAAIKLFPAVVVPPLVAVRLAQGDRRGALRLVASTVATVVALNLPFIVANPSGWWWPFSFQGARNATWGSAWFYVLRIVDASVHGPSGAHVANVVSFVALAGTLSWLVYVTKTRHLPMFATAAAAVAICLMCSKVYSPTYDVWLVPFFVVLPLRRRLWVTFCIADVAIFATVYGHFHGLDSTQFVSVALPVLVAIRTLVLLTVVYVATRPVTADRSAQVASLPLIAVGADDS